MSPKTLLLAALVLPAPGTAEVRGSRLAPIAGQAASTHGPYEAGDCAICHAGGGRGGPGKVVRPVNDLCFDCHDEFKGTAARLGHPAPGGACTRCHNPHNSRKRKLLL